MGETSMAEMPATTSGDGEAAGPAVQNGTSPPGKNGVPNGMAGPWKQERLEADSLLRSLHKAHCEDEKHRRWLLRRWPEWPTEGRSGSVADPERFIPECFLRDGEDDVSGSLQSVKDLVSGGLGLLQEREEEEDNEGGARLRLARSVAKLSKEGVIESIPLLVPKLERKALQSVLSILSQRQRRARNRPWLIEKVSQIWRTFAANSREKSATSPKQLEDILAVFRDPLSFRDDALPGQLVLDKATCPWSAVRSVLTEGQLEQFPLQCLHVMLEVLLEKASPSTVGVLPVGGNKERFVTALVENGGALLPYDEEAEADEPLPEPLRKALIVMSLSAKHAFGDDGNLIDFLGPISEETERVQDSLLSALSDLKTLNYENLKTVHMTLIGAPNSYRKRHPVNVRHPIRRVLLECLLRSEVRSVPEEVKAAAETIASLAMKQANDQPEPSPDPDSEEKAALALEARIDLELESTLQISSHLHQIMYNWKEANVEMSARPEKEKEEEEKEENEEVEEEVEVEDPHLTRIADEAAEAGYALIGSAMERTARAAGVSLKRPVRKYLRRGTRKKVRTEAGEGMNDEQHQLAMILKIAGKIPAISPRVMDNVKRRLGMG